MFKKVFDEEFNSQKMQMQIIKKYENKKGNNMLKILKYALPLCLILICAVVVLNNSKILKPNKENLKDNTININIIKSKDGITKFDADIKEMNLDENQKNSIFNIDTVIPSDLTKSSYYAIYTRNAQSDDYTNLNCYVFYYSNDAGNKNIRVAFSNNGTPIRDYYFDESSAKNSNINNHDLLIYQYQKTYFAKFNYNNSNFDIETNNISLDELTLLLKGIIK